MGIKMKDRKPMVGIRVSEEDLQILEKAAIAEGMTVAGYMRRVALIAAKNSITK